LCELDYGILTPYNAELQLKKRKRITIRPKYLHVQAHVGGLKF